MIDMSRLNLQIGLPTPDSNPQIMFEQIALLENQFKTQMSNSKKIAIAIEELPPKYQGILTSEMSKEGRSISPKHTEDIEFQYWHVIHGSYMKNSILDGKPQEKLDKMEVALMALNGTCNQCGKQGHKEADYCTKKHINRQALTPKEDIKLGKGNNQKQ